MSTSAYSRRARPRLLLLVPCMALLLAGCGSSGTKTVTETVTDTETVTQPSDTDAGDDGSQPAVAQHDVNVYFLQGEHLAVAHRSVDEADVATHALDSLFDGPVAPERAARMATAIPAGVELHSVEIEDGTATLDLSADFEAGGGSTSMLLRIAQVVYTATQFPTIERVAFELDGKPVEAIGGEGVIVDPPRTRHDFEDQAPPILVEQPAFGEHVSSPIKVRGTANVFEARFEAKLVDASGAVIARPQAMASAGTGTRGVFEMSIAAPDAHGDATLVVFSRSPKDGSAINGVTIPIVLD